MFLCDVYRLRSACNKTNCAAMEFFMIDTYCCRPPAIPDYCDYSLVSTVSSARTASVNIDVNDVDLFSTVVRETYDETDTIPKH